MLEYKIVKIWEDIKRVRNEQKFTSAGIKLSVIVKENSQPFDLKQELADELFEAKELITQENNLANYVYENELLEWEDKMAKSKLWIPSNGNDEQHDNAEKAIKMDHEVKKFIKTNLKPTEPVRKIFNSTKLEAEIAKRLKLSHPSKNMPAIMFSLQEENSLITNTFDCPDVSSYFT